MKCQKEHPRLLVTAEPFSGESLKGLLLRVCELNGYKHVRWLKKLAGYGNYHAPPQGDALKKLSILTGVQYARLQSFAYNVEKSVQTRKKNFVRYCYFGNVLIKRYWIEQVAAKICPRCLSDSPHARAIWDIKFVTACPVHGVSLIERCPRCRKPLRWTRQSVAFCRCGFDLRCTRTKKVLGPELGLNALIYKAAMHAAPITSDSDIPVGVLSQLTLPELLDFIIFLGRTFHADAASTTKYSGRLTLANAQQLTLIAVNCLESWPHKFQEYLQRTLGACQNMSRLNVARELKVIYPYMRIFAKNPRFNFIRQLVSDYLHERWDGGPARSSTIMRTLVREHTRYITGYDARRLLKCHAQTVVRLLESGTLDGRTVSRGRHRINLFDRESVENLSALLSDCVNTRAAAKKLSVTPRTLRSLEKARLLRSIVNPIRPHVRIYPRGDVESLLSLADETTTSRKKKCSYSPITFRGVLRRTRIPIARFLRCVQKNVIKPVDIDPSRPGIYKYTFDLHDVRALKTRFRRSGYRHV